MEGSLAHLMVATVCFVASHFVMSGPLRPALLARLGEQAFLLLYSLVSLGTFAWAIVAFDRSASDWSLWDGMSLVPWLLASVLTVAALAFLIPSFSRNPALPGNRAAGLGTVIPGGIFKVTRHPMMWGITFWALAHVIAAPTPRSIILMGGLIVLALLGSHLQDKRKIAGNKREFGPWQRRTSFWPRLEHLGSIQFVWLVALLVWFLATWVHYHFFGIPAGLWMWIG